MRHRDRPARFLSLGAIPLAALLCAAAPGTTTELDGQAPATANPAKPVSLFDGRTLSGWEGDTVKTWRVEEGAITGGSLTENVPRNEFLCTTRDYANFVLRLKFKLLGKEGFINSGVQFRSRRHTKPAHEMIGYQADLGDKYWGSLYDESRRNKTLVEPPASVLDGLVKRDDWNDYEVRAEGRRIRISLNGRQTIDY